MITSDELSDRCTENDRPSVEEIAEHFQDTIFWNWAETVGIGLDDSQRIECEYPLTVSSKEPDEDGCIDRHIRFDSGECSLTVATAHQWESDETATQVDAEFIANLPVYVPALFRRIRDSQAEANQLRNEAATANLKRIALDRIVGSVLRNLDVAVHRNLHSGDDPPILTGCLWGKVAHFCGLGSTSARELCREFGLDPDHETMP